MAIVSAGYQGTITNEDWPVLAPMLGSEYNLGAMGSFKATLTSGDRRVEIAPGTAQGRGVMDRSDTPVVVQHDLVASGVRYDLIVLRRHWGSKTSSVAIVKGGATRAIPAARETRPGIIDEQPLHLVRITAGSNLAILEADLRSWQHTGGALALDELALTYLDGALGAHIRIGVNEWVMQSLNGTTWGWVKEEPQSTLSLPQGKEPGLLGSRGSRPIIVQAGSKVLVSDANGFCQFEWGTPFPNGLLSVHLSNGDGAGAMRDYDPVIAGTAWPYAGNKRYGDRNGVVYLLQRKSDTAILRRTNHRTNYTAIGF